MRLHLRLMVLCTVAALAAGCSNDNNSANNSVSGPTARLSAPLVGGCETTVGDRIWFDVNCNGIQDKDTENGGPAGVKVTLIDCDTDDPFAGTVTDGNGYYSFANVPPGTYKVCFELPGGFGWSPADQTSDGLDSDAGSDGCTPCFILECDKPNTTLDAGLCEKKEEGGEGCTPGFWRNPSRSGPRPVTTRTCSSMTCSVATWFRTASHWVRPSTLRRPTASSRSTPSRRF
jgi:hypothetical protein